MIGVTMQDTTPPLWHLSGKTAVITGAASGLGRELALSCTAAGMRLVLADIDAVGLAQTLALTGLPPEQAVTQLCDVSKAEDLERLAQTAQECFGGTHLLFNNAGVLTAGPLWGASARDWQWMLDVNVMSVAHGIRSFVPAMLARGEQAWVVNTASMAGLANSPELGLYCASKHAVVSISECLHHELAQTGKPVGVSVMCPSFVATGITDAAKKHSAGEAAEHAAPSPLIDRIHQATQSGALSAADVARITLEAVQAQRFYILPHAAALANVEQRLHKLMAGAAPHNPLAGAR